MLEVTNLVKKYFDFAAVDGVSFSLKKGEILGLLGPNGAGKSTTIKVISTYLTPTCGSVSIGGHDVVAEPMLARRQFGYLPENVPLYPEMRVTEYLKFRAALKNIPRSQRSKAIAWAIEACQLGEMQRKLIGQLSKGYRQRVGLADVLLADPPLLILDEPTSGLDPSQLFSIRKLIKSLGKSIILSTHILPEVEATCDKVIILNHGKIVASDKTAQLLLSGQKSFSISAQIKGPATNVQQQLAQIPGAIDVTIATTDSAFHQLVVTAKADLRTEIYQAVAQNKWLLRNLELDKSTLENIFMSLTTTEGTCHN